MDGSLRAANPPPPPTGATQQELDDRWALLLADADAMWLAYMQQRTPKELQPHLAWYIGQNQAPPEPVPTEAVISDGDTVPVTNLDGSSANGIAHVASSVITNVTLPPVPSKVIIANGATVPMRAGATVTGQATVTGGTLIAVISPATAAFVQNNDNVVVHDAAGAVQPGSPGVAAVAASAVTAVKLSV